jgi:hypothetical protein
VFNASFYRDLGKFALISKDLTLLIRVRLSISAALFY